MARNKRAAKQAKTSTKRAKTSPSEDSSPQLERCDSENTQLRKAITAAVEEGVKSEASSKAKLDSLFVLQLKDVGNSGASIYEDYACMLNQTDVINNNNKFYLIQLAEHKKKFHVFTRWGRVGEDGQFNMDTLSKAEEAVANFAKKFTQKTGNKWENRADFVPKNKKYTLLVMDASESDTEEDAVDGIKRELVPDASSSSSSSNNSNSNNTACSLTHRTELMVKLIFSDDMFNNQMTEMNLDVKKMPLGKLSKVQIAKGLDVLIQLEEAVKNNEGESAIAALTSKFFTLIPHSFGRTRPPLLSSAEVIKQKKEVMITLSDIELTQSLKNPAGESVIKHPLDVKYESLNCSIELLPHTAKEFKIFQSYVAATSYNTNWKLRDAWCLDREGEGQRFGINDNISFRKLLWHGTNVAVVAAILNSGLRIMPHSGGLVGSGIYFASEFSKSSGYVRSHYGVFEGEKNVGFMFLSEVALGKSNEITCCDSSLKKAPPGYDSVVARGSNEPDPKKDMVLKFGSRSVIVPVGKPVPQPRFKTSGFCQSEYLVYNEHQVRLRFLLKFSD